MFAYIERKIVSIYMKLRYGSCVSVKDSIIRRCSFYFQDESNKINFSDIKTYNSKYILQGRGNNISIKKSNNMVYGLSVKIYGNNNKLIINENVCIYGLRIVIRGENCHVSIGKNFTENINCMITCMGNGNFIEIGDDCMFSESIDIWNTDSHQIVDLNGNIINGNKDIIIGDHVWIGKNCNILKGVMIGNNSVIGMGSVVTKDIESNSIYVGNPAKKVKNGIDWNRNYSI